MLEISPPAAELIRTMIDTLAGIEGIRVTLGPSDSPNGNAASAGVIIAPAAGPIGDDKTLLDDGITVFVDPDVAPLLEDKLLDVTPTGADQLRFTLTDQEP